MANQTITFSQPGIKIFMTDDCSFLDGMSSNTLTVDIRNTGENYIVLPDMYRVTDKNGNHPSGNNANGLYFTQDQAEDARSVMINSVYNGNEYSIITDQYRSMLTKKNSHIWDDYDKAAGQYIVYYQSRNGYVITDDTDFNSANTDWPSSINSDGLWFTGYSEANGYICQKVNDWNTYSIDYLNFMLYGYYNNQSVDILLTELNSYGLGNSNLYTIVSGWDTETLKVLIGLAYIGYGQTEAENVTLAEAYPDIINSGIRFGNIQFKYNGITPSRVIRIDSHNLNSYSEPWKVIKVIANVRLDQTSGNTESIIIVEKLQ